MKTKLVFIKRQIQIAVRDENDKTVAFLQMFINGTTGTLYSLIGRHAFHCLINNYELIINECGVNRVLIVMERETLVRMTKLIPKNIAFIIKETGSAFFAGKNMVECEIVSIKKGPHP